MTNNEMLTTLVCAIVVLVFILIALAAAPIIYWLKGTEWWKKWATQDPSGAKGLIVLMKIGLTLWLFLGLSLPVGILGLILGALAAPTCGFTLGLLLLMYFGIYDLFKGIWKDL